MVYWISFFLAGSFLSCLCHFASDFALIHILDDAYSHCLLHVTYSKASQRSIIWEFFHTHRLRWYHLDYGGISWLDHFGVVFQLLAGTTINLLKQFCKFASNMGSMAIQHWTVACMNFSWVVKDNDLPIWNKKLTLERTALMGETAWTMGQKWPLPLNTLQHQHQYFSGSSPYPFLRYWHGVFVKQSRTSLVGDNYLLFLQPKCFIQGRYCTEKFDADRSKGLQG